jgi:hypothetical protein
LLGFFVSEPDEPDAPGVERNGFAVGEPGIA